MAPCHPDAILLPFTLYPLVRVLPPEPVRSPMQTSTTRADRVLDTLLTGSSGLLAAMEPVTDLKLVRTAGSHQRTHARRRQLGRRLLQWRSTSRKSHCPSSFRRSRRGHDLDELLRPATRTDSQVQMHVTHGVQQNRAFDSWTEPRHARIRSHTRIAHSTLSTPHAHATSCRVSTCRHRRP